MSAAYPGSVRTFTTHTDTVDTVLAGHVNDLQDEVTALEGVLGTNPAASTSGGTGNYSISPTTYSNVSARLANLEKGLVAIGTKANDADVVHDTGNETVAGIKTFSSNPVATNLVVICTSGSRPSSPGTGQEIYETDTKQHLTWDGSAWRRDTVDPLLGEQYNDDVRTSPNSTGVLLANITVTIPTWVRRVRVTGGSFIANAAGVGAVVTLNDTTASTNLRTRTINSGSKDGDVGIIGYSTNTGTRTFTLRAASTVTGNVDCYSSFIEATIVA